MLWQSTPSCEAIMKTAISKSAATILILVVSGVSSYGIAAAQCSLPQRPIAVDGNLDDWAGIEPIDVRGKEHLWFGQGMTPDKWSGNDDLSYQWRGAWFGERLSFAVEVTDDQVVEPSQAKSFLCDCVEIYLDPDHQGGKRVKVLDGREDWFAKCDPRELMGYELHFLPADPPRVYLDHTDKYELEKPHSDRYQREWTGNVAFRRTASGYVMEIGFRVPRVELRADKKLGIEIGVCDDDGQGRESIMMWPATKSDFWLSMDEYGTATLCGTAGPDDGTKKEQHAVGIKPAAACRFLSQRNPDGSWGIAVSDVGLASVEQARPLQVEILDEAEGKSRSHSAGYSTLKQTDRGWNGAGRLTLDNGAAFEFIDQWELQGNTLRLERSVRVHGNASGGFLTAAILPLKEPRAWTDVQWFAPGMIYGGFEHLPPAAIGGREQYRPGVFTVRIREDRLPAPLIAGLFADGTTLAVLNPAPVGDTTAADADSVQGGSMTDDRFQFGSIGAEANSRNLCVGYWFPGSEGEVTYAGNTYPGGQLHQWRWRFHPIRDGFEQRYSVAMRFGSAEGLPACCRGNWRWAWQTLKPRINAQDIPAARALIVDALAANVIEAGDRAGIPNAASALPGPEHRDGKTIMGFTGKALESAEFMLAEAQLDNTARGLELRRKAEKIIASFLRLKMAPPEGEGFFIATGQPATALGHVPGHPEVYLRSFGDDMKALLRAYRREAQAGRAHPEWLAWARQFGDWLLTQQQSSGGFPRAWVPPQGNVYSDSPNASFNAIPLLTQLHGLSDDRKYLDAAVRAAEFCWNNGQSRGRFVGGTIDNPDVLDKEAATLSLEAYLMLFEATGDRRWLDRARNSADIAETWIYLWNVPMPADADNNRLHWKRGVPTTGLQLIATGHSLVDAYMAFDVDEYAKLYRHTGDDHYLDVARILLHNTKAMIALPSHPHDLRGIGWQQEHYSLAPPRGQGLHRLWLPWVSTSQLNGIFGLVEFDRELFTNLSAARP
jgi:hypothetical protein